jgi:aspartate racemase
MKTIGLLGGMSWESTLEYYRIMNEAVRKKLGGLHSAKILLYSFDFEEIEVLQHRGRWDLLESLLLHEARMLERAGAELMVIGTNTMHKLAAALEAGLSIPLVHIADATAAKIREKGLGRVALLGTRFTMEGDFYVKRLEDRFHIETIIPPEEDRLIVHRIIYDELCLGITKDSSRREFQRIGGDLISKGAEGIILGCTEIPLLVHQGDLPVPLFDTTEIHARAAVDRALE